MRLAAIHGSQRSMTISQPLTLSPKSSGEVSSTALPNQKVDCSRLTHLTSNARTFEAP